MKSYFLSALVAVVASCAITLLCLLPGVPALVAFLAIAPLVAYHGYLSRRRGPGPFGAGQPSDAEIDSVYYVGFLVTVMELAASALILYRDAGAVDQVLLRFAIGLMATAYAVVARLHLQSGLPASADDAERVWFEYTNRSRELLTDLELAVIRMQEFRGLVERELTGGMQEIGDCLRDTAAGSARAFKEELGRAADGARLVLEATHALLIGDEAMKARDGLRQQLASAASAGADMSKCFERLVEQGEAISSAFEKASDASSPLADELTTLGSAFNGLATKADGLPDAMAKIGSAAQATADAAEAAKKAAEWIAPLGSAAAMAAPAVAALGEAVAATKNDVDGLGAPLSALVASVDTASARVEAAADALGRIDSGVERMPERVLQLSAELDGLTQRLRQALPALESDVESSSAAVLRLANGLASLADLIIERTRERQGVA